MLLFCMVFALLFFQRRHRDVLWSPSKYRHFLGAQSSSFLSPFLPPHGRELAAAEEFTVFGDIRQNLGGNRGSERSVHRRDNAAFEAAVEAGDLEIVSTPSPILEDVTLEIPKMLKLDSGTLSTVDPCWHNSIS